jgi:hypothetical protein
VVRPVHRLGHRRGRRLGGGRGRGGGGRRDRRERPPRGGASGGGGRAASADTAGAHRPGGRCQDQARVPPRAAAIRHGSDGSGRGAPDYDAAAWGFGARGRSILGGAGGDLGEGRRK